MPTHASSPDPRPAPPASKADLLRWLETLGARDLPLVGGKNASLGELIRNLGAQGIRVPGGFATTANAYRLYLAHNRLSDPIRAALGQLADGGVTLQQAGSRIRRLILEGEFPPALREEILQAYRELSRRQGQEQLDVAVRSSATAEDLPEASFAGQQESYLNVHGEREVLEACRRCFASLFTDRAIVYRSNQGFDHLQVALSVGVQKMVRSDLASAGVIFTLDTETGFREAILISGAWGLGENVVQGAVVPDQFMVFKPLLGRPGLCPIIGRRLGSKAKKLIYAGGTKATQNIDATEPERMAWVLSDEEVLQLACWARAIEAHYGKPMDIEWAKDGQSGALFIVQARPETVQSRKGTGLLKTYKLKGIGRLLVRGISIGQAIASGRVCRVRSPKQIDQVQDGSILVTEMTDPDWVPILRKVAGIVTDFGGRTCHAAIVSRELGIPAVVGTGVGTQILVPGQAVTLSCAEGEEGHLYEGLLPFESEEVALEGIPATRTRIMLNIGSADEALHWWRLPCEGIGLARMEFLIGNEIKIHPMALAHPERVRDPEVRRVIAELTRGHADPPSYFVDLLARGIGKIAASRYPHPVIVRMSDFKTNEYANLIGGRFFETAEENPMIGFRGACRYYSERYRDGFALECRALRKVREEMGFVNVVLMIPFCRTLEEADRVLEVLAAHGLERGRQGLEVYVMCEIPSNVILAREFAERFDGFSIGSNDLTQLCLGIDRDSKDLAYLFDERNEAVKRLIRSVIQSAHACGRKVGICGQAPSDYPDFAAFLVEAGIDSISLNPDSILKVKRRVAEREAQLGSRLQEAALSEGPGSSFQA